MSITADLNPHAVYMPTAEAIRVMAENLAIGGKPATLDLNDDQRATLAHAASRIDIMEDAAALAAVLRATWDAQVSGNLNPQDLSNALWAAQALAEQISTAAYLKGEAEYLLSKAPPDGEPNDG